jgi:hypothetical protein
VRYCFVTRVVVVFRPLSDLGGSWGRPFVGVL